MERKEFYANTANVEVGPFDFAIGFGAKKDRTAPHPVPEDIDCVIFMSPEHAKVLVSILSAGVAKFEENFGVIPVDSNSKVSITESPNQPSKV